MAGTFNISTINVISPNGLVTKSLTVDNYGYAKIGDERVGITPQNWIINGQFDVWQRGTSQTSSGYGSDDRWANSHDVSTKTHSQVAFAIGQIDIPNNPTYFSRTVVTTGGTVNSFVIKTHRIEDVIKFAGKTITLSFWAKADANKNISIDFEQNFGSGGSASVGFIGVQKLALATSWKRFTRTVTMPSILGKTYGAGSWIQVRFWFDAGSNFNTYTDSLGNQSGTFDIANVCLVEGSVPVECPNEPYAEVLRKCQRYYQRIVVTGTYAAMSDYGNAYSTTSVFPTINLKGMRIAPSSMDYSALTVSDVVAVPIGVSEAILWSCTPDLVQIRCNVSNGLTQYRPYQILSGSSSAYIGFSAEL